MALDLGLTTYQLLSALDGLAPNIQSRSRRLDDAIDRALAVPADEGAFRTAAVGRRPYIAARTGPESLLGSRLPPEVPQDWTALSVDGSHIDVDRHLPLRCHLINLGAPSPTAPATAANCSANALPWTTMTCPSGPQWHCPRAPIDGPCHGTSEYRANPIGPHLFRSFAHGVGGPLSMGDGIVSRKTTMPRLMTSIAIPCSATGQVAMPMGRISQHEQYATHTTPCSHYAEYDGHDHNGKPFRLIQWFVIGFAGFASGVFPACGEGLPLDPTHSLVQLAVLEVNNSHNDSPISLPQSWTSSQASAWTVPTHSPPRFRNIAGRPFGSRVAPGTWELLSPSRPHQRPECTQACPSPRFQSTGFHQIEQSPPDRPTIRSEVHRGEADFVTLDAGSFINVVFNGGVQQYPGGVAR